MDKMNIVVDFARLWGEKSMDLKLTKTQLLWLLNYNADDLFELLIEWKNEYVSNEDTDDRHSFFNQRLNQLLATK